jgi:hypothetical protein
LDVSVRLTQGHIDQKEEGHKWAYIAAGVDGRSVESEGVGRTMVVGDECAIVLRCSGNHCYFWSFREPASPPAEPLTSETSPIENEEVELDRLDVGAEMPIVDGRKVGIANIDDCLASDVIR